MNDNDARLAAVAARYQAGAVLERGSSWTACRATERAGGRAVVLRVVEDDRLAQEANAQRFLAEAKMIAALDHPALVPLLDAGAEGRFAWTASQPATGPTLREVLAAGPLAPDQVALAGEQLAAALDAAHTRGVIHRDLRPENVVRVAAGAYRLAGFGTGRWMMAGARRTDGTPVAGVPATLSPELITGGAATVASDVHALGALLFELLTGMHPFAAADDAGLMDRLVREPPARPTTLAPTAPPELEQVILRALSKDPSSRFQTANAMQQALAACPGASGGGGTGPRRQRTIPTWAEMLRATQTPAQRMARAALWLLPVLAVGGVVAYFVRDRAPSASEDPLARAQAQIHLHPKDMGLRIQFGEQLERVGRIDDARQLYHDALKLEPKYAKAIAGLARIQDREGRPEEARKTYRSAVDADPKAWYAALELAKLLERDARFNEAKVVLEQGLSASPGQPDLTEALARIKAIRK